MKIKKKWPTKPRIGPRLQNQTSGREERAERRLGRAFALVDKAATVWLLKNGLDANV